MGKPFVTRVVSFGAAIVAVAMLAGCGSTASSQAASIISTDQAASAVTGSQSSHSSSQQTVTKAADTSAAQSSPAAQSGNFNQNPSTKLPDSISSSVPDSATVVSRDYAQKTDGTVVSLKDGSKVTDPKLVGTQDTPPDPLAISGGKRFIPVSVADTKKQMEQAEDAQADNQTDHSGSDSSADSAAQATQSSFSRNNGTTTTAVAKSSNADQKTAGSVTALPAFRRGTSLKNKTLSDTASDGSRTQAIEYPSNKYGTHWGTSGGQQAIFSRTNRRVLTNVLHGVDVSQFQQDINWAAARNAGVQAAVVRLGYGYGNGGDPKAARNVSGVRAAGIKYGFYWYSYAYNNWFAEQEAKSLIALLRQYGVKPGSTALPIYYDLEAYAWSAHPHPTSPSVYRGIVQTWVNTMRAAGYTNVAVYSYTSYLNSALNDSYIRSKTSWVAQYAGDLQYSFTTSQRSWQYDDAGHINGIPGNVDLDAFDATGGVDITKAQQITVPNGTYYIIPSSNATASVDVPGASTANSTKLATYSANGTVAQQFRFTRNADGTYTIINVHSGKALDVPNGRASDGLAVQQYDSNGTNAQKWYIRQRSTDAYYLQSVLGNWVISTTSTAGNSTPLELEIPGEVTTQQFLLSSQVSVPTGKTVRITSGLSPNRVVDVAGAGTTNNTKVDVYAWNTTKAQQFVFDRRGNSVFSIRNVNSGKVLDVAAGLTSNGAVIDQYAWNGTQAQLWVMRDAGSGYVNLYNPASGRVMEIPGASTQDGTQLKLYTANGTAAQKWKIEEYTHQQNPGTDTKPAADILPDGVYRFESATDRSSVMEVAGASRTSGANVSLYRWNGTDAQKWCVRNLGDNIVTLTNVASGKLLDLVGRTARDRQNIDQYTANGTTAQKWHVEHSGDGFVLRSVVNQRFVVDLAGNDTRDRSNIDVFTSNGTTAQKWYAAKISPVASSVSSVLPDGVYRFESATDRSRVFEDAGGSRASGANVGLYRWNGTGAQKWRVRNLGGNVVTLTNMASGKLLDLVGAAARDRQNVDQYTANGTAAQKWYVTRSGDDLILHSAVNRRFVVDLAGNDTRDRSNIDVFTANGTTAQEWYVSRVD